MSKEVNEQAVETATVQETENVDVDVDFEKRIKSEVSKAQHKLLQDLGISNVKEGKELFEKGRNYEELVPIKEKYETLQKEHENFKSDYEGLSKDVVYNQASIKLLKEGFNPERLESIKPLIKVEAEVDEEVERIKQTFPELFLKGTTKKSTVPQREEDENLTEAEKYIKRQKEIMKR